MTAKEGERVLNTHSSRCVRATIEGGVGVLPWSAGVNAGDSGIDGGEKTEKSSSNNAELRSYSHFSHTRSLLSEGRERK